AALDKLKKGEVSAPVLTSDGYHIIDVRDVREGHAETFAQVRDQLVQEATKDARQDNYRDVGNKLTDMIYNDPTSLKPAAEKLGLTIQTTPLFGREGAKTGLAADPKVVKAAFSDLVLAQGNTSDPIDLGNDHMVVIHVSKHVPAATKPLADVSDQIKQALVQQRVDASAKSLADAALAKLQDGAKLDALAQAAGQAVQQKTGVLRNAADLDPDLLKAVFEMAQPAKGSDTRALVPMEKGRLALGGRGASGPAIRPRCRRKRRVSCGNRWRAFMARRTSRGSSTCCAAAPRSKRHPNVFDDRTLAPDSHATVPGQAFERSHRSWCRVESLTVPASEVRHHDHGALGV